LNNDIVVANYGQTIIAWSLKTKEMVSFFLTHQDFSLNLYSNETHVCFTIFKIRYGAKSSIELVVITEKCD